MSKSSASAKSLSNVMWCYVKLSEGSPGASGRSSGRSSSVVDDSGRPINWLSREGGGVIQVAVALETIWFEN